MTKPHKKTTDWGHIRVSKDFAKWLREEADREGRFIHVLLQRYVEKALDGRRPWEKQRR